MVAKHIDRISKALNDCVPSVLTADGRVQAAVAIILKEGQEGLEVLLIKRAENERDPWSGHIAFPGGRSDDVDANPRETAERESREELGLDLAQSRYLGRLSDIVSPRLRILISVFVYGVDICPELFLDHDEIADAFWFPLCELHNRERRAVVNHPWGNRTKQFPALRLCGGNGQPLWGITYRVLRNLDRIFNRTNVPSHGLE